LQVASEALVKAVDPYDRKRGRSFTTFAVPSIAGELKRYFRDRTRAVRVPRSMKERVLELRQVASRLERDLGREPSEHELARALGTDREELSKTLQAARARRSPPTRRVFATRKIRRCRTTTST
jgi:RNA polymerase sigma-B factor